MNACHEFKYNSEDNFEVGSWTCLHLKNMYFQKCSSELGTSSLQQVLGRQTYLETGVFVSVIITSHDALQDAVLLLFLPGGDLQVAQHQLVLKATFIRHHLSGCGQDTFSFAK